MKRYLCGFAALGLVLGLTGSARAQPGYVYTALDLPGNPFGINNAGQIVGSTLNDGFLYQGGSYTKIDVPGWSDTYAVGINNKGQIVGEAGLGVFFPSVGFVLSGGNYTTFSVPNAVQTRGNGINDSGQIVGNYVVGNPRLGKLYGFELTNGNFTLFDVPGARYTELHGINDSGQIVGFSPLGAFLLIGGSYTPLSVPGSAQTFALGINNSGQIVGSYSDSARNLHGFLYDDGNYSTLDVPASFGVRTEIDAINDLGQIVGNYFAGGTQHAFLATPTPEPTTLLLLSIGTLGLLGWAWRRRKLH